MAQDRVEFLFGLALDRGDDRIARHEHRAAVDHLEAVFLLDGDELHLPAEGDVRDLDALAVVHLHRQARLDHENVALAQREDHVHVADDSLLLDHAGDELGGRDRLDADLLEDTVVLGAVNVGDATRHVKRRHGDLACDKVGIVVPHERDEQVGVVDAGVQLHCRIRAVTLDEQHLRRQRLGQVLDRVVVFLDDDDAVVLLQHHVDEVLRCRAAAADND